jgi:hypothetical protein
VEDLLRRAPDHGGQVVVDERFAADEEEVADVVVDANINDIAGLIQGDAAAPAGIKLVAGEPAKIALGVADIGDGELKEARSAVVEDFAEQFENRLLFFHDGAARDGGGGLRFLPYGREFGSQRFHITA